MNSYIIEILKDNWGEKAETLNCFAEVRFFDPLSSWACYVFAMHKDERLIHCLLYSDALGAEIHTMDLEYIKTMYNEHGEPPQIDKEFRKTKVIELLRRLNNDT